MVMMMGRECEGDVEGRNVRFGEEDRVRTPQGLPDGIRLLPSTWILSQPYAIQCTRLPIALIWGYLRPSGSKGQFLPPIPRCHEKDLSYVGDRTNISRSTAVMLNSTYYAPHHCPQVLSLRRRPAPKESLLLLNKV